MKNLIKINAIVLMAALFSFSCSEDSDSSKPATKSKATVVTGAVSSITMTGAMVAGEVTSDGNATVTDRGICWGLSSMPTVSDSVKSSGSGVGAYTITLDALTANTIYYVRAFAMNSEGISYGSEVMFTTDGTTVKKYKLGEMFEGGVIYYLNMDSTHGLAFADTVLGTMGWGCHQTEITGALGVKIGDGVKNTADIIKECNETQYAAKFVSGLSHGGYTGWHLPSRDELVSLYRNWIADGKGKLVKKQYWCSNQNNNNRSDQAQVVDFANKGALNYEAKSIQFTNHVVAVKEF